MSRPLAVIAVALYFASAIAGALISLHLAVSLAEWFWTAIGG